MRTAHDYLNAHPNAPDYVVNCLTQVEAALAGEGTERLLFDAFEGGVACFVSDRPRLCFKLLSKGGLHSCSIDFLPVSGTICFLHIAWIALKKQDGMEIISGAPSAVG